MPDYVLEIVEGPEAGRQIPLPDQPFEIGRDGVGVELKGDELVSRAHVRVTPTAEGATVEDLDSRNGTFVDGNEIHSPAYLTPGGQLLVGVTVLELRGADELRSSGTAVPAVAERADGIAPARERRALGHRGASGAEPGEAGGQAGLCSGRPRQGEEPRSDLDRYLDMHTKNKTRAAPIALFVLVALVVLVFLAFQNERSDATGFPASPAALAS